MPNLEAIEHSHVHFDNGAFEATALAEICFPKLLLAGSRAFYRCQKIVEVWSVTRPTAKQQDIAA